MDKETLSDDVLALLCQVASALEEQSALRAALAEAQCQVLTLQDSPRHQFIYTSADASRPCRNGGSLVISTRRFARVQRVFCFYPAYLLGELRFLRHGRLHSAYM